MIERDYNPIRDEAVIAVVKTKIFDAIFDFNSTLALQFLSRAFAGHNENKDWAIFRGNIFAIVFSSFIYIKNKAFPIKIIL